MAWYSNDCHNIVGGGSIKNEWYLHFVLFEVEMRSGYSLMSRLISRHFNFSHLRFATVFPLDNKHKYYTKRETYFEILWFIGTVLKRHGNYQVS